MQYTLVHALHRVVLCAALAACASVASARDAELYLAGVGLHQETGRDIYLGGILLDTLSVRPDNLVTAPGPKAMEYRVIARRTSIRSLLGSMLLQGEVANDQPPGDATRAFANAILSTVQGSLYAGDKLQIRLTADNTTIAYLNGHEISRSAGRQASNYLLAGWVNESGPSTSFRNSVLMDRPSQDLASRWDSTNPSAARVAEVSAWPGVVQIATNSANEDSGSIDVGVDRQQTAAADTRNATAGTAAAAQGSEALASQTSSTEPSATEPSAGEEAGSIKLAPISVVGVAIPNTAGSPGLLQVAQPTEQSLESPLNDSTPQSAGINQGTQVAALMATPDILGPQLPPAVADLNVEVYAQRLSIFNTALLRQIYGQINYPARAVRRGIQGSLELDLLLDQNGRFIDVSVVRSSGHSLLDKAALAAARKALAKATTQAMDPVAIAEYSNADDLLVVPVPVSFVLTE